MKAMIIEEFGKLDQVKLGNIPTPEPEANEVQIKITYAAINPVDWKICEGLLRNRMPYEFPITLGWDVAGVISKIGSSVAGFELDDEVFAYARKSKIKDGTLAEYICLEATNVALKPKTLSLREAAAIPLTGLTAWQALFDAAKLTAGETILVHAGAGGVGSMAIQFAHVKNAKVITTASPKHHAYVKQLGANVAIDYHQGDFVSQLQSAAPQGIDVIFDTVGGDTLTASLNAIKPKGRVVSILQEISTEVADRYKISTSYVFVKPNGKQLKIIAELIDEGKVVPPHISEFSLDQSKEALQGLKEGHTKGKVVIKI